MRLPPMRLSRLLGLAQKLPLIGLVGGFGAASIGGVLFAVAWDRTWGVEDAPSYYESMGQVGIVAFFAGIVIAFLSLVCLVVGLMLRLTIAFLSLVYRLVFRKPEN